jgi:phosphatidylserine/phosphatidylglycerophosphate/cardiolipin synthase-like enzyme
MKKINVGVNNSKASLVAGDQYQQIIQSLCMRANRRIYVSMFLIELIPMDADSDASSQTPHTILELMETLKDACLRGIDVRVLIGGAENNAYLQDEAEAALTHCQRIKIPCRLVSLHSNKSCHKKVVVVDDMVVTGSHNWSHGAFTGQIQHSVFIEDPRLASYFASGIAKQWRTLEGEDREKI